MIKILHIALLLSFSLTSQASPQVNGILLYTGPGADVDCWQATQKTIARIAEPSLSRELFNDVNFLLRRLEAHGSSAQKILVIVPGGNALEMDIAKFSRVFNLITKHEHNYLGICAGAILPTASGCRTLDSIEYERKMRLEEKIYGLESIDKVDVKSHALLTSFFCMSPTFKCAAGQGVEVLGTLRSNQRPVLLQAKKHNSHFILSSIHPEFSPTESAAFIKMDKFVRLRALCTRDFITQEIELFGPRNAHEFTQVPQEIDRLEKISREFIAQSVEEYERTEHARLTLFRDLLLKLGVPCLDNWLGP